MSAVAVLVRREGLSGALRKVARVAGRQSQYQEWVAAYDSVDEFRLQALRTEIEQLSCKPRISIIVPVFNTPLRFLTQMIDSVMNQTYPHWELCLADDASTEPHVRATLHDYSQRDSRIRVAFREKNGHICAASNTALELATGEYLALLDHDDVLPPHALAMVAKYIDAHPDARLLYSDEDKISEEGLRSSPYFKPDWDPELIVQQNFFSHLGVFDTQLVRDAGGFRQGLEGSQDHDLVLRCLRIAGDAAVVHIPHVLYHWRTIEGSTAISVGEKPYAVEAGVRAIRDHLAALGVEADVVAPSNTFPFVHVDYALPVPVPTVHVVVRASGNMSHLTACLTSLLTCTQYPRYHVSIAGIAAENAEVVRAWLNEIHPQRVVSLFPADERSMAAQVNAVVTDHEDEYLCLLDDAVEMVNESWLEELVKLAARPHAGLVGPALYSSSGAVCAAGLVMTSADTAVPALAGIGPRDIGYFGYAVLTRAVSALPDACLVVARSVFLDAGGLRTSDAFGSAANGIDLSTRVAGMGRNHILVPRAKIVLKRDIHNSKGTGAAHLEDPVTFSDHSYNPNLALTHDSESATFDLSFPPRIDWNA